MNPDDDALLNFLRGIDGRPLVPLDIFTLERGEVRLRPPKHEIEAKTEEGDALLDDEQIHHEGDDDAADDAHRELSEK